MTIMPLDPHGQPVSGLVNRKRRVERDLSELLGLAKGMLADGVVNDKEAEYLVKWGLNHPDGLDQWPTGLVFTRLNQVFADGRIDETERVELKELLASLIGGMASVVLGFEGATTLPLDEPPPMLTWSPTDVFVFTGKFAYGPRRICEREVLLRGAQCENAITHRTTVLVIGTFGSEDWRHSSYGTKIQRAVDFRSSGVPLRIVGEDHWANALGRDVSAA